MRKRIISREQSLGGSSDLTLKARIRSGFVESLEAVTHKTRIKSVLRTLQANRRRAHEYSVARLLSDAVERVGIIQSVRVAILEPQNEILLAVSFDGTWESYIRTLWSKVGALLDLIFFDTVDYVTAADHTFEEWLAWARRVQVETDFFYGTVQATAFDLFYYKTLERYRARYGDSKESELVALGYTIPTAENAAKDVTRRNDSEAPDRIESETVRTEYERFTSGISGLSSIFTLADLFLAGHDDGEILLRAARCLLSEFIEQCGEGPLDWAYDLAAERHCEALRWLFDTEDCRKPDEIPTVDRIPRWQSSGEIPDEDLRDIQGGILRAYTGVTHGCLLLLSFDSPTAGRILIDEIRKLLTVASSDHRMTNNKPAWNLALTPNGLRSLGMNEVELSNFSTEFLLGMEARAGLIGDVRGNHPDRWNLPLVWGDANDSGRRVTMDSVHAVLQIRFRSTSDRESRIGSNHIDPLSDAISLVNELNSGIHLLAVQSMHHHYEKNVEGEERIVDHFGFVDGLSQPDIDETSPEEARNRAHFGEFICGHGNDIDEPPAKEQTDGRADPNSSWLTNGTYLVLRKYRLDVSLFEKAIASALESNHQKIDEMTLKAKLVGRYPSGLPILPSAGENGFNYSYDTRGETCPLHAHIRRANPRPDPDELTAQQRRMPRIIRRGMSFGPRSPLSDPDMSDDSASRGLIFMAYNSSIAEQFEVIQRWLTGSNSSGSTSNISCPLVGVPESGHRRIYRFSHQGQPIRITLDGSDRLFTDPPQLTRLEWGLYLFVPSRKTLRRLSDLARLRASTRSHSWSLDRGRRLLNELMTMEATSSVTVSRNAWKAVIEDPESIDDLDNASLCAAIRTDHAGVLRTSYGLIVADRDLILKILVDRDREYSVCGQMDRMRDSFGEIYLGMDEGPNYRRLANPINSAIESLSTERAFLTALSTVTAQLERIKSNALHAAKAGTAPTYDTVFQLREVVDEVLAALSEDWFGISDKGGHFVRGGHDWNWEKGAPPRFPGHFTAISRYMFQPNPGCAVERLGQLYGRALVEAMNEWVKMYRSTPAKAPLAESVFSHPEIGQDDLAIARTIVGVLMGFTPTLIGTIYGAMKEWLSNGEFWRIRARFSGKDFDELSKAEEILSGPLRSALRARPMPRLTWRTAVAAHRFEVRGQDPIDIAAGDRIVLVISSGTQQSAEDGRSDRRLMFGGERMDSDSEKDPDSPTHACPGYEVAMATVYGVLAALLGSSLPLRPGPSSQTLRLKDQIEATPEAVATSLNAGSRSSMSLRSTDIFSSSPSFGPAKGTRKGHAIMAWGDSWFDHSAFSGWGARNFALPDEHEEIANRGFNPLSRIYSEDIRDRLEFYGYEFTPEDVKTYCSHPNFGGLRKMASGREKFYRSLKYRTNVNKNPPRSILISCGGNDCTGKNLEKVLIDRRNLPKDRAPTEEDALISGEVFALMKSLTSHYRDIVSGLVEIIKDAHLTTRIFLHGYDYPIPRAPGLIHGPFSDANWLGSVFDARHYEIGGKDRKLTRDIMIALIDNFNEKVIARIKDEFEPHVVHIDLRGKLASKWKNSDPEALWVDELHPDQDQFDYLASIFDEEIQKATNQINS
ncbi:MAG: Dyp-type peroxidase [Burkholderiaceae bacterium]|nr:Dyp-type peroxidase [Burkholderiaceae bacterium]